MCGDSQIPNCMPWCLLQTAAALTLDVQELQAAGAAHELLLQQVGFSCFLALLMHANNDTASCCA